jgi:hypothetical protein
MKDLVREGDARRIVVIDGTSILLKDEENDPAAWYKHLQGRHWVGFIAIEADVFQNRKLDFWGLKLIEKMLSYSDEDGKTLLQLIDGAKRADAIKPWGLLFGVYVKPSRKSLLTQPAAEFLGEMRRAIEYLTGPNQSEKKVSQVEESEA